MLAKDTCRPLTPALSPKKKIVFAVRQGRGEGELHWLPWNYRTQKYFIRPGMGGGNPVA